MKTQKMIRVTAEKCLACKSCEMACAVAHSETKSLFTAIKEEPLPMARIQVEGDNEFCLPIQCRHCEDAPCVKVCPTKAIYKPTPQSPVIMNKEVCIGCKWCILVCPFGVIQLDRSGKTVTRCDLCLERTEKGEEPACVDACPTGALEFMPLDEIAKKKREKALSDYRAGVEI
ncbi:MAG: 4Fe-4S dicluster domain-containing protein [Chloroflexi bacterium]|nr:4Fe-4S dicluster domain-containing protein [Chloroflexota bacterium]